MSTRAMISSIFAKTNNSGFLLPCIVSWTTTAVLFVAVHMTRPIYGVRTCVIATVVSLAWLVLFVLHQRSVRTNRGGFLSVEYSIPLFVLIALASSFFLICTVWGRSNLSLAPFEQIDNGTQKLDCLFHSAVAESFERSVSPVILLNNEQIINYHTFSHLLFYLISKVTGIPVYLSYNYFFPVIFYPLYLIAILFAISCAKKYFKKSYCISMIDVSFIMLFVTGISINRLLEQYAVWKSSYITSESFLVANTLSFFAYGLLFIFLENKAKISKRNTLLLCLIAIPLTIFIISWSKISTGMIFAISVIYYVCRTGIKDIRRWLLCLLYGGVFLISGRLFNSSLSGTPGNSTIGNEGFRLFAFSDWCSGKLGIWGHYLILLIMPLIYIVSDVIREHYSWKDVKRAKTVYIEELIVVCFFAFLPGFIIPLDGGAAVYFSYVVEVVSLILLCGHGYPEIKETCVRNAVTICLLFWCIFLSYHNRSINPFSFVTGVNKTDLSSDLFEIRDIVGDNAKDFTIYLDKDSLPVRVFEDSRRAAFVCPALTGVGVINASYVKDGITYTFMGEAVKAYGLSKTDNEKDITFEEAVQKAHAMGKRYIIHYLNEGFEIIICE